MNKMESYSRESRGSGRLAAFCSILLSLGLTLPVLAVTEMDAPEGWRLLNDEELAVEAGIRETCESDYCRTTQGDWNGDSLIDGAALLMRQDGKSGGLWAYFAKHDGTREWQLVEEVDKLTLVHMGVSSSPPGSFVLPCYDEYECNAGEETKEFQFENAVINVYYFEASGHYRVWNPATEEFDSYWFSD